jgi:hypothetical protein
MLVAWLRGLWQRITSVPELEDFKHKSDPDIHAEARNAAQRFSSSSRLVGLRAAKDSRETRQTLEGLRQAQCALDSAKSALEIVERGRHDAA